jgi:hypothetical protein
MITSRAVLLLKRKTANFSTSFSGERTKKISNKVDVCVAWTTQGGYKTLHLSPLPPPSLHTYLL